MVWALAAPIALNVPQASAEPAGANQTSDAFTWRAEYRESSWVDYAAIGVTGGIALAGLLLPPDRNDPWRSTLGVDESVRDAVRLEAAGQRRIARSTSDVLAGLSVTLPTLGDAAFNAGWMRHNPKLAWEMSVINLEVLGITAALVGTAKLAFSRERPFGRLCGSELDANSPGCTEHDRYVSYFSGHASFTFASASATCVHHHHFPLWGEVSPWVPCATGYVLAATTGALRIAADRHYVSDVLTGAFVGTAVGLVVPWLHYSFGVEQSDTRVSVRANGAGAAFTLMY